MTLLGALHSNPFATQLTVSHNQLGDDGTEYLAHGILQLRKSGRSIAPLKELNLSSNGITDKGLVALVKYLLLPSESPDSQIPTLTELILSNNGIALADATPHVLSTALSHPLSSLRVLSLNTNQRISESSANLAAFLRHLESDTLHVFQLNACGLGPEDARSIAEWLSEPGKGGKVAHLELNANAFGTDSLGTNRIAKVVYAGLNTSLIRLELAANERSVVMFDEDGIELPPTQQQQLSAVGNTPAEGQQGSRASTANGTQRQVDKVILGDDLPWKDVNEYLRKALLRNHVLQASTKHTALQLLPVARVLLHAKLPQISASAMQDQVYAAHYKERGGGSTTASSCLQHDAGRAATDYTYDGSSWSDSPARTRTGAMSSPLLRLPPELVRHVLRCYSALEPIPLPPHPRHASSYNPGQGQAATGASTHPTFASPLSEAQFSRILALAQDRSTLSGMTQRYDGRPRSSSSSARDKGRLSLHDARAFLDAVRCSEYERVST